MAETIRLTLAQRHDYQFDNQFEGGRTLRLLSDEPVPIGLGDGPSPAQLLLAAAADCLSASLLFALRKYGEPESLMKGEAECEIDRNGYGRLRVMSIQVALRLGLPASAYGKLARILTSFEDFCTVSQSIAQGIPVITRVYDADGVLLKDGPQS